MSRREVDALQSSLKRTFNQLGYRVTDTELKVIVKNSRNYEFWNVIQVNSILDWTVTSSRELPEELS